MSITIKWPDATIGVAVGYLLWQATRVIRYKGSWAQLNVAITPGETLGGGFFIVAAALTVGYVFGAVAR